MLLSSFKVVPLPLLLIFGMIHPQRAMAWGDVVPGSRYDTARSSAMGEAYIPVADSGMDSLFYNPAGIARIRKTSFELANLELDANQYYLSRMGTQSYKVTSLPSYSQTLAKEKNNFPSFGATLAPNFSTRYFAFGVLFQERFAAVSDGYNIRYRTHDELTPAIGTGIRLASGVLRIGYSLQYVNEAKGDKQVPLTSSGLSYTNGIQQGAGISHNVGFAVTLPQAYLPEFNIVGRNLGGLKFSGNSIYHFSSNPSGVPATEKASYDGAISFSPKTGGGGTFNLVAEYRDMTNTSHYSAIGRAAAGMEFSFRGALFWRAGVNDGYPSAGVALQSKSSSVGVSWYSQETGATYHSERDIRCMFQYTSRIF